MIVSTPGRLLHALNKLPDFCKNVRHVVLDEADLLLSYGYEAEMKLVFLFLNDILFQLDFFTQYFKCTIALISFKI